MQPGPIELLATTSGEMITVWPKAEAENCHEAARSANGSNDFIRNDVFGINWGIAFGGVPAKVQPLNSPAEDALKRRVYVIVSH